MPTTCAIPPGLDLHLVGEVEVEQHLVAAARLDAPVAEQVDELPRVLLPRDEQHLAHADALQQLQRVVDHRPAPDRQQVLVRDARQLLEPGRVPPAAIRPFIAHRCYSGLGAWPRAAARPRIPATTPTAATHIHMVASP